MITSGWVALEPDIEAFLNEYDGRGSAPSGDTPAGAGPASGAEPATAAGPTALFAPNFLAVDPARAIALTPDMLARALPARRRMFDGAGVGEIRRTDARQLRIDDLHVLISADWAAERTTGEPLRLSSMFLVRREPAGPRILVYLNHNDVTTLLANG